MIDLDLTEIGTEDLDQLASKIESYYKQDGTIKTALAYHWEKNHLFLDGQQWITYDGNRGTGGIWRPLQPMPQNEYIPRPVTNYTYDAYQTLKAYLLKNKPRLTVRPNTQSHEDKSAAKVAELVTETNWERLNEQMNCEIAASSLLTYGTVIKKNFWDTSSLMMAKVPVMQQIPQMDPQTGQPNGQMDEVHQTDEEGNPVFQEIPLGDLNSGVVEPLRFALDPLAIDLADPRWVAEWSIKPLNWIVENYTKDMPGYTNRAQEVKEEKNLSSSMQRFYNLRASTGVKNFGSFGSTTNSAGGEMVKGCAVVKEYYERPTAKYPKGRLVVVANGIPLYAGDSPYEGPEKGDWHPYSECRWELFPGRFWGKSPLDYVTEINKQINSIDSVIALTRKTMAVPQKLEPKGSIPDGQWTGMPGQRIQYRPGPNGEKPELLPALGVNEQVFKEREQKKQDIQQISGAVDILKGDRPPGVTAASAISILFEVATGKLGPILDRWKLFIEKSEKKKLRIVAKKFREPRPDFIKMLLSYNRDLVEDDIQDFIGEDLRDNCNVIMEAASSIPKIKAAEQQRLIELANMGLIDMQDPKNRIELLERFGINGFNASTSLDIKRAEWENDLLDELSASPDNKPVVLEIDNDAEHIKCHEDRMKQPAFMSMPIEVHQAYNEHIQQHRDNQMRKMQEQMMQQATMNAPMGGPQGAPQGQAPSHQGPETPEQMREAMSAADVLGPSAGVGQ